MFGDYMAYADDKPMLLVCDGTAFLKILPRLDALMVGAERGFPRDGAKEHCALDIDDTPLARDAAEALLPVTAVPMPKKPKKKTAVARNARLDRKH
jgi:TfoX/Sxy family transcriptional regulator of competence genes